MNPPTDDEITAALVGHHLRPESAEARKDMRRALEGFIAGRVSPIQPAVGGMTDEEMDTLMCAAENLRSVDRNSEAAFDLAFKLDAIRSRATVSRLLAFASPAQTGGVDQACQHRIADARNPVVRDGYVCVDCGALFRAADHGESGLVGVTMEPLSKGEFMRGYRIGFEAGKASASGEIERVHGEISALFREMETLTPLPRHQANLRVVFPGRSETANLYFPKDCNAADLEHIQEQVRLIMARWLKDRAATEATAAARAVPGEPT